MCGYTKSVTFGGGGGGAFSDDLTLSTRLAGIVIRHGSYVDGIRGIYQDCNGKTFNGPFHGGSGGTETIINFAANEYIVSIEIRHGSYVDSLKFNTNLNIYGPYGGSGGSASNYSGKVGGFFGRSGTYLDQVGFFIPCD